MQSAVQKTGAITLYPESKTAKAEASRIFALQRISAQNTPNPDYKSRKDALKRLALIIERNRITLCDTLSHDYGNRAREETLLTEINSVLSNLRFTKRQLRKWMRPTRRSTSIWNLPGSNKTVPMPVGVVGIMVPWNYPINLALVPAIAAIAAGNRVMIKMPELVPELTGFLKRLFKENFTEDQIAFIDGDAAVANHFAGLPFDHLLFTGSATIGKKVMKAAAPNLTPVTLELGGKSPAIIGAGFSLKEAAKRITWGRLFNAGQTCVAADYAFVPAGQEAAFADAALSAARTMYPELNGNPDYSSIINDGHIDRLKSIVTEAVEGGATLYTAAPLEDIGPDRKFPLCVLVNPPADCRAMTEELFGPILPVVGYQNLTDVINQVNDGDAPLAAYYFGGGKGRETILKNLRAGGMVLDDTLLQYLQDDLPFGGVGGSGFGQYHGKKGFETFTHDKAVFTQRGVGGFTGAKLIYPPYGPVARLLLTLMRKI
ncbi:MAG: aldehyde dehydrogenase family protein [Kordiimonadaceae bacterium]|nr:aldehyde dehydrogenase family protein [Kordiimonadaceae bacterium]